jgi:1-acyl-sn-glycerol-3-phosphate acyltransferase
MKIIVFLRAVLATVIFPFTVIIIGPIAIATHLLTRSRDFDDFFMILWGRVCCFIAGVKIKVEGAENIPNEGCLFLFNHSSFFDIFAMSAYIKGLKYGAKAELFKIPIFAQVMKIMRTLPIARNNREEVIKIYEEAKKRFADGERFALSPEGGRFYDSEHLYPFKAGPFIFAMSAGAPVVPIVILGAHEVLPKGTFLFNNFSWSLTITLKILKPIHTKDMQLEQRRDLQKNVYDQMDAIWSQRPRLIRT